MTSARSAGWYADPVTVGAARYWNGRGWTTLVAWGGSRLTDPTPLEEVERRARLRDNTTVNEYLDDALERGVVTSDVVAVVRDDLLRATGHSPTRTPSVAAVSTPSWQPPVDLAAAEQPRPVTAPALPKTRAPTHSGDTVPGGLDLSVPEPAAVAPGRVAVWWDEARRTVRSDLALHGLAYLGVLLLFAGVTGLIVFSFGGVDPWVRSMTELLVPAALFLSAWYLSSRNAKVVGDALALLGGAVTPIIVAAAFTDGAPVPPDVSGRLLPVVQGISVALVAMAMVAVTRRHPSSPLRFLVGPILWLAAGLAAGALRDPVPTGYETARPEALQLGIMLAALTLTVLAFSLRGTSGQIGSAVRTVALPAAGVVYVLELVLASGQGWPAASTILTGVAGLVLLEAFSSRLPNSVVGSLQFAVAGIAALRLSSLGEPQWIAAGSFVTLLALLEYVGPHRRDRVAVWVGLAATATALLATLAEPVTAAVGFGVLAIWGLYRYLVPADWLPARDPFGVVPAIGAAVATGALWQMIDPGVAVVATSAAILLLAIAGRTWEPVSSDALWAWFVPAAAATVVFASLGYEWGSFSVEVAMAGVMSSLALALSALPLAARVWASSGALVWALANTAEVFEVSRDVQAIALGIGGLALVAGSLALSRPPCVHLAAVGHLAGLLALAVPIWPGWAPTTVAALAAVGWWMTTLIDNHGEAVHLGAFRDTLDRSDLVRPGPIDVTAELAGLAALGLTVVVTTSAILAADAGIETSWVLTACAAGLLLDAGAVRAVHWERARRTVFEWATFAGVLITASGAISETAHVDDDWSAIATTAIGLAVIAIATAPRPAAFVWTAWVGGAAITLLLGNRLGLEQDSLDTLLVAWGAGVLLGGVGVQRRRHGPLPQFRIGGDRALLPPVVLGSTAFAVGGISALSAGGDTAIGWTAAAMATIVLAVALLLPLGALAGVAEALATLTYALLAPWNPLERPATFVPWVVVLLVAALLTRRSRVPWPTRWDLPSFLVAHAVGGYALILAVTTDTVATTFASLAAVTLGVAVVLRRVEWAIAAAVLLLIAGGDAGRGWLALVLAVEGLVLTVTGLGRAATQRWVLVGAGAVALVGAWFDVVVWLDWSVGTIVQVTVPVAAVVALVAALGRRVELVPVELAAVWASVGTLVSVGSMISGVDEVPRLAGGLTFAGSVLVLAATASAWVPLLGMTMRWAAAGLAAIAWLPAAWAVEASTWVATLVGTAVALGVLVFLLALHGLQPTHPWIAPSCLYALGTQALATVAALDALPEEGPIAIVLLAVSAELVALGVVVAVPQLFVVAPAAACAALVLATRDTAVGDTNWLAVPVGVTLLVMVGLVRWIRRGRGAEVTTHEVVILELVAMTVIVEPPIGEVLAGNLWNAVLAVVIGSFLAVWGALTRVVWRAAFGAATVALTVVLVIGVPLSTAVTWRGPALWVALSLLGIAAIVVASALERGREAVRQVGRQLDVMTQGWEHIPPLKSHDAGDRPPGTAEQAPRDGPQPVP